MSGITTTVRRLVLQRDDYRCVSCLTVIDVHRDYSIQHRIPRGMGGTRDPRINAPGNLLTVCGSATTGCHEWMESHRMRAREWGYLLFRSAEPTEVPVLTAGGWVLFDNNAHTTPYDVTGDTDRLGYDAIDARLERLGRAA